MDDIVGVHNTVRRLLQAREFFVHAEAWQAATFPIIYFLYASSMGVEVEESFIHNVAY